MNDDLELLTGKVPGTRTTELTSGLQLRESRNVTFFSERFPVFWESASGATITDVDGNRYIDLTAAFGVANAGHSNVRVAESIRNQAERLMHGMGDVHPTEIKAKLLERLPQILPAGLDSTFLATTGAEAVEAALKTAMLATGKPAFAAYRGAYHGLSLGALGVCGIPRFREPFAEAVSGTTLMLDFPRTGDPVRGSLDATRLALESRNDLAAIIVEPIQGRGGVRVPPPGYLSGLRQLCDRSGILLIFDEIFTGFGRTGTWFATTHEKVTPDIICLGKAMGSGFPISAMVARRDIMDAWPISRGEALHTSTFLGNPMGCAAALATIAELERLDLPARAQRLGNALGLRLATLRSREVVRDVRGRGLMWGLELADARIAERVVVEGLAKGIVIVQSGPDGNVLSITPPLVIGERQLDRAIDILEEVLTKP